MKICDDCGNDEAYETICPYAEEILNEIENCNLCYGCEHERMQEI